MKVMAFVMAFYIIMTTPRFPVMLKQLVGFTDSDVSLRLKTVADQAAASSNVASLVPLRIRRSTYNVAVPFVTAHRYCLPSRVAFITKLKVSVL